MSVNPSPDPKKKNEPSPYSFDDEERPPNVYAGTAEERRKWEQERRAKRDDSLSDDLLDVVEDMGCTNRLFGCVWSLGTLPFRLVWRVIGSFFD